VWKIRKGKRRQASAEKQSLKRKRNILKLDPKNKGTPIRATKEKIVKTRMGHSQVSFGRSNNGEEGGGSDQGRGAYTLTGDRLSSRGGSGCHERFAAESKLSLGNGKTKD